MPLRDRSLSVIVPAVFIFHLIFIAFFLFSPSPALSPPKRIVVSTVKLQPKIPAKQEKKQIPNTIVKKEEVIQTKEEPVQAVLKAEKPFSEPLKETPSKASEKKSVTKKIDSKQKAKKNNPAKKRELKPKKIASSPKKKALPSPKNVKPLLKKKEPIAVSSPSPPSPSSSSSNAFKEKQRALLSKAKEKIGKINTESSKIGAPIERFEATPSPIGSLSIEKLSIDGEAALSVKEMAYREELGHRLRLLLKLPEYGEIKVRLTLERSGKVLQLKVISAESEENKVYVEKALPKLKMPPFGTNFSAFQQYTFTITMSNDS